MSWEGSLDENPLVNFGLKLKRLRVALRHWNWNEFGDLRKRSKDLIGTIEQQERSLQDRWSPDLDRDVKLAKAELMDVTSMLLDMQKDKARLGWIKDGDKNSKLFHAAIRARASHQKITLSLDNGETTEDAEQIGLEAVNFFGNLFNGYTPPPFPTEFKDFHQMIGDRDNERLCADPSKDEVWTTVSEMNEDSAPSPDGFTVRFYKSCWNIIENDIHAAVLGFFRGLQLPKSFTATHLILVPKVQHVTSMSQMRSISLCNVSHKIISKILSNRLAPWLPQLISEEQAGYVRDRSIHEHVALAHDLAHDLNRNVKGGNLILKLDVAKAYDRISWSFILMAFRKMGFKEKWCDFMFRSISNCFYSNKWAGKIFGHFK